MTLTKNIKTGSLIGIAALALTACAGAAAGTSDDDSEAGFEYGASQEEINEAIEGLEPVTLNFQADAPSAESIIGEPYLAMKEEIEEKSKGQITVDIAWGHSITGGLAEIPDALADGRVDLATLSLAVDPQRFSSYNELNLRTDQMEASPYTGMVTTAAMMPEMAWNNSEVMAELEENNLMPLNPVITIGDFYFFCNENSAVAEDGDLQGKQIRIGTLHHTQMLESVGASTLSMEWPETYEALGRGVMDCVITIPTTAVPSGTLEVAPNVNHGPTGAQIAAGLFAGSNVQNLPVAYQQIIFDAEPVFNAHWLEATANATAEIPALSEEYDGEVEAVPQEAIDAFTSYLEDTRAASDDSPVLAETSAEDVEALAEKWSQRVEELGFTDDGEFGTMHEWYDPETADFESLAVQIYEEALLPHRP